jgi:hypothetical protein
MESSMYVLVTILKLPNISSLIEIAFHQTTLPTCVTILLHPIQIYKLLELILTICWVIQVDCTDSRTEHRQTPYGLHMA